MDTFDRIMSLLRKKGMTQADLSRATGISTGLISQWKKRMQSPSAEKLKLIADYFNVSTDYLLGNEKKSLIVRCKKNEWISNKGSRLYMCIDSWLLETLELISKEDGVSLEDKIEDILYWDIQNRIDGNKIIRTDREF